MLSFKNLYGAAVSVLLAAVCPALTASAHADSQEAAAPPVTVTLQVPLSPNGALTTITVEVRGAAPAQPTHVRVTSNADRELPAVVAAHVGANSVQQVRLDAESPFVWNVLHTAVPPGCGPHPPAGVPGCSSRATAAVDTPVPVAGHGDPASAPMAHHGAPVAAGPAAEPTGPMPESLDRPASPTPVALQKRTVGGALPLDAEAPPTVLYTVQPGDTLTRIAQRFYGDGAAAPRIAEHNVERPMPTGDTFGDPDLLQPGWVLALPGLTRGAEERNDGRWYTVQSGDTLERIAAHLLGDARRWRELYELNHGAHLDAARALTRPSLIWPGLRLRIPSALDDVSAVVLRGHDTRTDPSAPPGHAVGPSALHICSVSGGQPM